MDGAAINHPAVHLHSGSIHGASAVDPAFVEMCNANGGSIKGAKGIPAENVYWNRAKILIRTTNLKSLKDEVKMKIGNQSLAFESVANISNDSIESLETNYFDYQNLQNEAKFNFTNAAPLG